MCQLHDAKIEDYAASSGNNDCTPQLNNWSPITWICSQTPQQDTSANSYYIEVIIKGRGDYFNNFEYSILPKLLGQLHLFQLTKSP